jgi:hypothetical protein
MSMAQSIGVDTVLSSTRNGSRGGSGVSSAARVSKGSVASERAVEIDTTKHKRSESEHITITVILYHVVKGGIPTREDVVAAVSELDNLYTNCTWSGNLKDISAHNVIPNLVTEEIKWLNEEQKFVGRTSFPAFN